MSEQESIEKEIQEKQRELELVKRKQQIELAKKTLKPLSEWTDAEKIAQFDDFYADALDMLKSKIKSEDNEDDAHYTWESYMETLLKRDGADFWKYYNSL